MFIDNLENIEISCLAGRFSFHHAPAGLSGDLLWLIFCYLLAGPLILSVGGNE